MSRENSTIDPIDLSQNFGSSPTAHRQLSTGNINTQLAQLSLNNTANNFQTYTIRVKNVPYDITPREAYVLFALADDLVSVELQYSTPIHSNSFSTDTPDVVSSSPLTSPSSIPTVLARFGSIVSAQAAAVKLDSKPVFGQNQLPVKVEFEELVNSQPATNNTNSPLTTAGFIPPPNIPISGLPPLSHTNSFQQPFQNGTSASGTSSAGAGGFQQRASIGSQRSRFLFGEDLNSGLNGKSILLMESQNDAREYDQLVRGGPWGPTDTAAGTVVPPKQPQQPSPPQPTTPSLDWARQQPAPVYQPSNSPQSTAQQQQQQQQGAIPDLSLLARVPPPVNPADQNPPCNTLYVGNLPPDATEAELRALFAPQKGFRRLSFRTKVVNQNSTGNASHHGPMCFVEFEDVAHATRALAELYGRALPRPGGVPGKGGIRLSFSKNPLGVRGPGQQRRSSTNTNNNFAYSQNQFQQMQPQVQK